MICCKHAHFHCVLLYICMTVNFHSMRLTTWRASFTAYVKLHEGQVSLYMCCWALTDLVPEEAFGQWPVVHLLPLVVEVTIHQLPHIAVNGQSLRYRLSLKQVRQHKVVAVSWKHRTNLQVKLGSKNNYCEWIHCCMFGIKQLRNTYIHLIKIFQFWRLWKY